MKQRGKEQSAGGQQKLCVILLVAVVLACNILAEKAVARFNLTIDTTSGRIYELTPVTAQLLSGLQSDITVSVIGREQDTMDMIREVLRRYEKASSFLTVRYVDAKREPKLIEAFYERGDRVETGGLVVESATGHMALRLGELVTFNSDMSSVVSVELEQQLTSAIRYVMQAQSAAVLLTQGHNEQPGTLLSALMAQNHFTVNRRNLSAGGAVPEADIIMICGPTRDFSAEEIQILDKHLNRDGKGLLVFLNSGVGPLPRLEHFLLEQGIAVTDSIAEETVNYLSSDPSCLMAYYAKHPITELFLQRQYYTVVPQCRILSLDTRSKAGRTLGAVLMSGESSYAAGSGSVQSGQGPFVLAAAVENTVISDRETGRGRLFIAGSQGIFADQYLRDGTSYGNGDLLAQAISWCDGGMAVLNIPGKSLYAAPMLITPLQSLLFGALFCGLIPVATLFLGFRMWKKRRSL